MVTDDRVIEYEVMQGGPRWLLESRKPVAEQQAKMMEHDMAWGISTPGSRSDARDAEGLDHMARARARLLPRQYLSRP